MPKFTGVRVMMMPYLMEDIRGTLPGFLQQYVNIVETMSAQCDSGVGYLTVDEAFVRAGETHRRPGLHVDGVDETGSVGGWGGGGGWGTAGMTVLSSHVGCRAWYQWFDDLPKEDGDCEHLRKSCKPMCQFTLEPGRIYKFEPLTVHESIPMNRDTERQFVRVSYPSNAAWYEGYTENPLGIKPTGPIRARRPGMDYRP